MWTYQKNSITSVENFSNPEGLYGFVYIITDKKTGKFYIGKRIFNTRRKKKLTKKERSSDKRLKTYKHVVKESGWVSYWGSNTELKDDLATYGEKRFTREITALAYSKKELNYLEIEAQILKNVLRSDNCYNGNISGRFYRRDLKS